VNAIIYKLHSNSQSIIMQQPSFSLNRFTGAFAKDIFKWNRWCSNEIKQPAKKW